MVWSSLVAGSQRVRQAQERLEIGLLVGGRQLVFLVPLVPIDERDREPPRLGLAVPGKPRPVAEQADSKIVDALAIPIPVGLAREPIAQGRVALERPFDPLGGLSVDE